LSIIILKEKKNKDLLVHKKLFMILIKGVIIVFKKIKLMKLVYVRFRNNFLKLIYQ